MHLNLKMCKESYRVFPKVLGGHRAQLVQHPALEGDRSLEREGWERRCTGTWDWGSAVSTLVLPCCQGDSTDYEADFPQVQTLHSTLNLLRLILPWIEWAYQLCPVSCILSYKREDSGERCLVKKNLIRAEMIDEESGKRSQAGVCSTPGRKSW